MASTDVRALFSGDAISADMFDFICGPQIGFGISRATYECQLFPDCVVKIEYDGEYHQNILEWQAWRHVMATELAKWFAPCLFISPCGKILIQKRTKELKRYPEKIPAFFTDTKNNNWGSYKGHPVCHDYGCNLLMEKGMTKAMRKAHWW
ncbi:hypothetical protein [Pseudohongiella sp. O18]|uniref:hypothetical protein n=1 Tax=Pseudohongiella sp. O18 TaxID=2904248 RepID=UPI001F2B3E54|nr:hypothetical protein [Pseudohongiella sp. O18]